MRTPHRRYSIRGFLKQVKPDFLALQETHLEHEKISFYVAVMNSDYAVISSSSHGRKRGVALIYRKELRLLQSVSDAHGRYVWGKFLLGDQEVFVDSVYAPNDASERIDFWRSLRAELPSGRWIISGDWNAVISSKDSSSNSNVQTEEEAIEFQALCSSLQVGDARERAEKRLGPKFTRAQVRERRFIWSRLDMIYVPGVLKVEKIIHHTSFWTSDHIPTTVRIKLEEEETKVPRSAYSKADYYVVQHNLPHLQSVWQELEQKYSGGSAMESFLKCWSGIRAEVKALQYEKRQRLLKLPDKEKILNALLQLDADGMTEDQERELSNLMLEVRELQAWDNHRWRLTCRENFIKDGDVSSEYFFRRFRKRRARVTIKKLKAEDGRNIESPEDINMEIQTYYTNLYRAQDVDEQQREYTRRFLENTNRTVEPDHNKMLDETPGERELKDSLWLLPSGKSPGPDGMTTEVLKLMWPFAGRLFSRACAECWESGNLHPAFKEGLIVLLPKGLQPETISQWRPITLLNVVYKVLAKLLASRLALILPQITPVEQQGFLKGRSTFNCILTFCMVHEALKMNRSSDFFYSLDQEKAYDRVLPYYLWETMSKLGFSDKFVTVVRSLQTEAESRIMLNGRTLPAFQIGKGRNFPTWAASLGFTLVVTTYLGAPLTTIGRCTGKEGGLLTKMVAKVNYFTSPFVSFDARILVAKHVLFPTLMYQLFTTVFKKTTLKRLEGKIREYIWSTDRDRKAKVSMVAWETLTLPKRFGGLGLFDIPLFQQALMCRCILRALADPQGSLWSPIFARIFLGVHESFLGYALCVVNPPTSISLCPVTSLLLSAWKNFISLFRWRPTEVISCLGGDFRDALFLAARSSLDCQSAAEAADSLVANCRGADVFSLEELQSWMTANSQGLRGIGNSYTNVLEAALSLNWRDQGPVPHLDTWVNEEEETFGPQWKVSKIYETLVRDRGNQHYRALNDKWRLRWTPQLWGKLWGIMEVKGLSNRHKNFIWRILVAGFMDGRRAHRIGLPDVACAFCGVGIEDMSHAVWLCPRWTRIWRDIAEKIHGFLPLVDLRDSLALLPQVLLWATHGSKSEVLFRLWMLALTWRVLWSERCALRFQARQDSVTLNRIAVAMLEEVWARRSKIEKN
ncbi:hypothetical protein R1sor_008589 [Riccia sorocarpa]|uniref:Reverse transcriptase domain-containing protein n=1 Tax=Riccia sorocarpa TaxID=122646 RepID=A0ABD3HTU5_9MARC